jgi:hypothetical protein
MRPKDNNSVIFLAFANELGARDFLRYIRNLHDKNLDSQDDCSSAQ